MRVFRFLSDEDDGVSETVIEFAVQYIGVLKVSYVTHPCRLLKNSLSNYLSC